MTDEGNVFHWKTILNGGYLWHEGRCWKFRFGNASHVGVSSEMSILVHRIVVKLLRLY